MNIQVECRYCHAVIPGMTRAEATQDALALGWQQFASGWQCADCLDEQDAQR